MAKTYYDNPNRNIPNTIECHMSNIIVYIASMLFTKDFLIDPQKAYDKILISDVNAGADIVVGDAIQFMKTMNNYLPFAAYNIGEPILSDYGNNTSIANEKFFYEPDIDSYVRAYPVTLEIQWLIFYATALDHRRAYSLLGSAASSLTRLFTPVMFGNKQVSLPIDLNFEFTKGTYTGEFEQYLNKGRIFDISLTTRVRYYEYLIDDKIYPVDDVLVRMFSEYRQKILEHHLPDVLMVTDTDPLNGTERTPLNKIVQITFNNKVKPETIVDNVTIIPNTEIDIYFDESVKILTINPISGYNPLTEYIINLKEWIQDENDHYLIGQYGLVFITDKG